MKLSLYYKIQKILLAIPLLILFVEGMEFSNAQEGSNSNIISFSIPVGVDKALIYSGPGENYYSTGELSRGDHVDIFMRNPEGWCAIRPPKGCFSWINARFIQSVSGEIGLIRNDEGEKDIPVRVGAESVMKSSVIQVGLKGGRKVRILGESSVPGGSRWYKIAPPAGEFRWIHEKMLYQDSTIQRLPSQLTLARKNLATLSKDELQEYPQQENRSPHTTGQNAVSQSPASHSDLPILADRKKDLPVRPNAPEFSANPIGMHQNPDYKIPYQEPQSLADGFYLEVSRLDRDLYNAINQGAHSDVYSRLSERCEVLFKAAQDDQQRSAVKNVFDTVEQLKNEKNITTSIPNQRAPIPNPLYQGNSWNHPNDQMGQYPVQPQYTMNQGSYQNHPVPSSGNQPSINQQSKSSWGSRLKNMQFAFSKDQPFIKKDPGHSGGSHPYQNTQNRSIFTQPTGPTLVPPPDYVPLQIPVPTTHHPNHAVPSQSGQESKQEQDPSFIASKKEKELSFHQEIPLSKESIRPVNVVFEERDHSEKLEQKNKQKDISGKPMDIASWTPPDQDIKKGADLLQTRGSTPGSMAVHKNGISYGNIGRKIVPVTVQQSPKDKWGFDAVGRLGYFPDHPEGYPLYALVDSNMQILCFVEAESGQKLDRFVGKMIGVKGQRGWFQRGSDGKLLITAKSIFTLK